MWFIPFSLRFFFSLRFCFKRANPATLHCPVPHLSPPSGTLSPRRETTEKSFWVRGLDFFYNNFHHIFLFYKDLSYLCGRKSQDSVAAQFRSYFLSKKKIPVASKNGVFI
ncbi:MAG: hypothetical protein LBS07_04195, partial [Prevotellaceae bacterium]|nr:hypothetical protein [Prevotellaceae bacterium]